MYWIIPFVIGFSVATAIVYKLNESASIEREEWAAKRERLLQQIHDAEILLSKEVNELQDRSDFESLRRLYIYSIQTADNAYILMKGCQKCIAALNEARENTVLNIQDLIKRKADNVENELNACRALLRAIKNDREQLIEENNNMRSKVRSLNKQTVIFKEYIRDNCGTQGKEYYEFLERRKQINKYSSILDLSNTQ